MAQIATIPPAVANELKRFKTNSAPLVCANFSSLSSEESSSLELSPSIFMPLSSDMPDRQEGFATGAQD
ncbi:hypothetical protein FRC14_004121 [Serendipita sp. 396]|nr:hypothetical protein FRC14_004121 [Serendipita sp. 396]